MLLYIFRNIIKTQHSPSTTPVHLLRVLRGADLYLRDLEKLISSAWQASIRNLGVRKERERERARAVTRLSPLRSPLEREDQHTFVQYLRSL